MSEDRPGTGSGAEPSPEPEVVVLGEAFCAESVAGLLDDTDRHPEHPELSHNPVTVLDVMASPGVFARHFAVCDPDPADVALLSALDPRVLSAAGRVDLLIALRRHSAALRAASVEGLAVMVERVTDDGLSLELGHECANAEVSTALLISPRVAAFELSHATQLATRLPGTMGLLKRGVITDAHAFVVARETVGIEAPDVLAAVETSVLARGGGQTAQLFARSVKRAVIKHNHVSVERQHRDAVAKRVVEHTPRPDGMAEIWALLPAEDAAAVMTTVRALAAHRWAGETRTADQRRADAFTRVFVDALNSPGVVPTQHGTRPTVQVTIAVTTLLGLNDLPGELDGHGPVPAAVARRIAADPTGTWRRLLTDPATGDLLDYGRTRYTPPQDLTDFVIARDQYCDFPTCAVPAKHTDLDHHTPYPTGPTNKQNLRCRCRRHHRLKHQTRWQATTSGDPTTSGHSTGTHTQWRSPTGHTHPNHTPPLHDPDADNWGPNDPQHCALELGDRLDDRVETGDPDSGVPEFSGPVREGVECGEPESCVPEFSDPVGEVSEASDLESCAPEFSDPESCVPEFSEPVGDRAKTGDPQTRVPGFRELVGGTCESGALTGNDLHSQIPHEPHVDDPPPF